MVPKTTQAFSPKQSDGSPGGRCPSIQVPPPRLYKTNRSLDASPMPITKALVPSVSCCCTPSGVPVCSRLVDSSHRTTGLDDQRLAALQAQQQPFAVRAAPQQNLRPGMIQVFCTREAVTRRCAYLLEGHRRLLGSIMCWSVEAVYTCRQFLAIYTTPFFASRAAHLHDTSKVHSNGQ